MLSGISLHIQMGWVYGKSCFFFFSSGNEIDNEAFYTLHVFFSLSVWQHLVKDNQNSQNQTKRKTEINLWQIPKCYHFLFLVSTSQLTIRYFINDFRSIECYAMQWEKEKKDKNWDNCELIYFTKLPNLIFVHQWREKKFIDSLLLFGDRFLFIWIGQNSVFLT